MATFVIVHGAWDGGWSGIKVARLLQAQGHTVYRPTLTDNDSPPEPRCGGPPARVHPLHQAAQGRAVCAARKGGRAGQGGGLEGPGAEDGTLAGFGPAASRR
jgi:hypothetical protein